MRCLDSRLLSHFWDYRVFRGRSEPQATNVRGRKIFEGPADEELVVLRDRGVWPARYQTIVARLGIGTPSASGTGNGAAH
jgi:hypothetical protein